MTVQIDLDKQGDAPCQNRCSMCLYITCANTNVSHVSVSGLLLSIALDLVLTWRKSSHWSLLNFHPSWGVLGCVCLWEQWLSCSLFHPSWGVLGSICSVHRALPLFTLSLLRRTWPCPHCKQHQHHHHHPWSHKCCLVCCWFSLLRRTSKSYFHKSCHSCVQHCTTLRYLYLLKLLSSSNYSLVLSISGSNCIWFIFALASASSALYPTLHLSTTGAFTWIFLTILAAVTSFFQISALN